MKHKLYFIIRVGGKFQKVSSYCLVRTLQVNVCMCFCLVKPISYTYINHQVNTYGKITFKSHNRKFITKRFHKFHKILSSPKAINDWTTAIYNLLVVTQLLMPLVKLSICRIWDLEVFCEIHGISVINFLLRDLNVIISIHILTLF